MKAFSLRRRFRSENGAVTIPAIFWIPLLIMILLVGIELMLINVRQLLLDHAVDTVSRELRLGTETVSSASEMKTELCDAIHFISDCTDNISVAIFPVDTDTWSLDSNGTIKCTDSSLDDWTDPDIDTGSSNELVAMRVCLKVLPMLSTDPLAEGLDLDSSGRFALTSTTVFVNEPR